MVNYIRLNKKIYLKEYKYEDKEEFQKWYDTIKEENYGALLVIWNKGIDVYLVFKKIFIFDLNVGFVSLIDCSKLSKREREMVNLFEVPPKFNNIFINDMRMIKFFRRKGIGTLVINKIFEFKNKYLLEPTDDGVYFWRKFGFEYNKIGKFAVMDNR